MTEEIKCNLVENALDYLLLAGEQAKEGSPRMLKHALATLADGVELLLKARIEAYDWCLLFRDVDQADRSKINRGDFQSVTFDQAVKRLNHICNVEIEDQHRKTIDAIRKERNRIRHFALTISKATAISLITKTYSFAIDFCTNELEQHTKTDIGYELADLRAMLGDFREFIAARMQEIQHLLDEQTYSVFVDCPVCLQPTLFSSAGTSTCAFCGFSGDGESAASLWADRNCPQSLKDSLIDPVVGECPECASMACVPAIQATDDSVSYICLSCGQEGDYEHCTRCGTLCSEGSVGHMCDNCREHIISGWD